jgi:hypothetical protein
VFFGPEFLNIQLLLFEEQLAFQEGLCTVKLVTYYICIPEIYYYLCHDPGCEDFVAVFLSKSNRLCFSCVFSTMVTHFMASLPTGKKPHVFIGLYKPLENREF